MCNFENILRFSHFSIALDMLRITLFLAEIMNPENSASRNFLTFYMSVGGMNSYDVWQWQGGGLKDLGIMVNFKQETRKKGEVVAWKYEKIYLIVNLDK